MSVPTHRKFFAVFMVLMLVLLGVAAQPTLANGTGSASPDTIQPAANTTLYLPVVKYDIETFEPNDTPAQAYGPINSGVKYSSVISTKSDYDYYFFNITTLGNVTISLTTGASLTSPLEITLYDQNAREIGATIQGAQAKQIVFTPAFTGKYYVRVCLCSVNLNPPQFYDLTVTYNGPVAGGDVTGQIFANGAPSVGTPLQLKRTDSNNVFYTVGDSSGNYHFRGQNSLASGSYLQMFYNGVILGTNFIHQAQSTGFYSYSAGSTLQTGMVDISPIRLGSPADNASMTLPVTFSWTPRATSPAEVYHLILYDPTNFAVSFDSGALGHNGTFTLNSLPSGFVTNHPYAWMISATGLHGEYDFSWSRSVTFAP